MKTLDTTFIIDFLKGDPHAKEKMNDSNVTTDVNIFETMMGIYVFNIKVSKFYLS